MSKSETPKNNMSKSETPKSETPKGPTNEHSIIQFLHCGLCLKELTSGGVENVSPRDYQNIEFGWTKLGMQVWCKRHDCNILHVDFEGQTHPANIRRKQPND